MTSIVHLFVCTLAICDIYGRTCRDVLYFTLLSEIINTRQLAVLVNEKSFSNLFFILPKCCFYSKSSPAVNTNIAKFPEDLCNLRNKMFEIIQH